ncbi:MAG: hypothetical protein FWC42_04475 [Proteobacteria bacterium]|nr:hypothetical protein [Pseudomonadota bacterium]MCL2309518.1 hypothetical protein [Pseudomonadota bacterium]
MASCFFTWWFGVRAVDPSEQELRSEQQEQLGGWRVPPVRQPVVPPEQQEQLGDRHVPPVRQPVVPLEQRQVVRLEPEQAPEQALQPSERAPERGLSRRQ